MDKILDYTIISNSFEETFSIAKKIGEFVKEGAAILLYGDLGSGKTSFVQGLGCGLEVSEKYYITSPTYTLINEYSGKFTLFHVDLYRINGASDLESIGFYDLFDDKSIVAIEWAEKLEDDFLNEYLMVNFDFISDSSRIIKFSGFGKKGVDLIKNIKGSK
jgi:tRNA threonylcarbamoyladenosine biosynthesis protein TsaE